ncbi:tubulinyl-Tyr carboxypeptidase 1-like isoform X1 [Styela clava]
MSRSGQLPIIVKKQEKWKTKPHKPKVTFNVEAMTDELEEYGSDDEDQLDNFPFYVNKSGLPIEKKTWDRMWRFACKLYPDARSEIESINNSDDVKIHVQAPILPTLHPQTSVFHRIRQQQNYINALQYNHTGTQFFEIRKNRPIAGLLDTAREMTREALPIKCLEAVILAIYLTNTLTNVERFPIGFKSIFDGNRYYHIVLGLYYNGKFGAMGISRRKDLMDKPLVFRSLNELIQNYNAAYANYGHNLKKVRLGGAISHDSCSQERIIWTVFNMSMQKICSSEGQKKLDRFTKDLRSQLSYPILAATSIYERSKQLPLPPRREKTIAASSLKNLTLKPKESEIKNDKKGVKSTSGDSHTRSRRKSQPTSRKYQVRV